MASEPSASTAAVSATPKPRENPFGSVAELASVGGSILFATDDFFAVAENLIMKDEPVWEEKKFTEHGKWMDGWESRRKRTEGHDWCILKLGLSGVIKGVDADTAFFTGNQTPRISIQAANLNADLPLVRRSEMGTACTNDELAKANSVGSDKWEEILPMSPLLPGYPETRHNYFDVKSNKRWTHLRVNYYPDGGVARLRVYGEVAKDWNLVKPDDVVDLIALENGGMPLSYSNSHYGNPFILISPGKSAGMYDGWETARNPNRPPVFVKGADGHLVIPGKEWVVYKLGTRGVIEKVIMDTSHFKGNYPESALLEGADHEGSGEPPANAWFPIVKRTKLGPNAEHVFAGPDVPTRAATHARISIYPDGGVARLRCYGKVAKRS